MSLVCFFYQKETWETPLSKHPDAFPEEVSGYKMIFFVWEWFAIESMDVIQSQKKSNEKKPILNKQWEC